MSTYAKQILLLTVLLLTASSYSQRDSVKIYIENLYDNWRYTYDKYQKVSSPENKDDVSRLISNDLYDSVKVDNYLASLKAKESEYYNGAIGLGMNAGLLHNPSGGEQGFDNIIYKSRIVTDLGWDILRSGYIHNRMKSQIADNERKIALIEEEELKKNAGFAILWNFVVYQFNLQKIQVLNDRMKLAQDKKQAVKKLYLLNKVDETELIKHLESIAEIRSMYRVYKDFNDRLQKEYNFTSTDTLNLPLIDINYNLVKDRLDGKQNDSIIYYEQENIDLKNKFINEISLRTSVRYSYYDLLTTTPSHRDFMSIGLSLGIPLDFNHRTKKEWLDIKKENIAFIPEKEKLTIQKSVLNNYYEFRYKLKQYTSLHYKHLKFEELLRKENARYSIDYLSFNPVSSLRALDDLMKVNIEMLDLKQQMYLKLISIHADLPYSNIEELFNLYSIDDEYEKVYSSDRSVYIWDNTFDEYDPIFLLNYIEKENFSRAVISFNKSEKNNAVKAKFIDTLLYRGHEVEIMTGKNSLLSSDPVDYFKEITSSINLNKISAIHLDVEPHTFDDWQDKKEHYLNQYLGLLDSTLIFCKENSLKLSVSIPLHYPRDYINKIYDRCDLVYFMAYENIDTDYIIRKVEGLDPSKTIISLRTEDFNDLLDIEMKIIDLQTKYKPKEFIIHDLRRLLELEKK